MDAPLASQLGYEVNGRAARLGLIGYGYWGPNLARNIYRNQNMVLYHIADVNQRRAAEANKLYNGTKISTDPYKVIFDDEVDAVVITTPADTHYELASAALSEGKHVLVSKPMTRSATEARKLSDLALRNDLVLMVDHTFVFSSAVRKISDILTRKDIGQINVFHSSRINLGLFRSDVSVVWDLVPHDLSILLYLLKEKPEKVSAVGAQPASHINYSLCSVAYINLMFASGLVAHLHVSWLSPVKVRQTIIGGSNKMVIYDDLDTESPIKLFDKGVEPRNSEEAYDLLVQYRSGDMYAPKVERKEPLSTLIEEFATAMEHKRPPVSDGTFGLEVVTLLEAVEESIAHEGACIAIPDC